MPKYLMERQDSDEIRKKILEMPYRTWERRGFSKGTLHYMKRNAIGEKPFTMTVHVRNRLEV